MSNWVETLRKDLDGWEPKREPKGIILDDTAASITRDYIYEMVEKVQTLSNANAILAAENADCVRAIENNKQTIAQLTEENTTLRAQLAAVSAERDALLNGMEELSYMTEPHARGALGRFLTAEEISREWKHTFESMDDQIEVIEAERDAFRAALALAIELKDSESFDWDLLTRVHWLEEYRIDVENFYPDMDFETWKRGKIARAGGEV